MIKWVSPVAMQSHKQSGEQQLIAKVASLDEVVELNCVSQVKIGELYCIRRSGGRVDYGWQLMQAGDNGKLLFLKPFEEIRRA